MTLWKNIISSTWESLFPKFRGEHSKHIWKSTSQQSLSSAIDDEIPNFLRWSGASNQLLKLSERTIWGQTWWILIFWLLKKVGFVVFFLVENNFWGRCSGPTSFFSLEKQTVAYWRGSPLEKLSLKHPWCNWLINFVDSRLAYSMSRPAEASPPPSVSISIPRPPLQELPAGRPCFLAWGNRCSFSVSV